MSRLSGKVAVVTGAAMGIRRACAERTTEQRAPVALDDTQPSMPTDLFDACALGPYRLSNRIAMAPLTRSRARSDGVPVALMAEYYAQRASAGLLIAEGTNVSVRARGYAYTPGLYMTEQVEGWRRVTDAVHGRGGHIFVQLWHVGRISHPSLQLDGAQPLAPSAIRPDCRAFTEAGYQPCVTPRAIETFEIAGIVEEYCDAARNALAAGFDGVEIHAANGYLIEQFMRDSTNRRSDRYGGTHQNRVRFLFEVVEAVSGICDGGRTGVRLSPLGIANDIGADSDPESLYRLVVSGLNAFDLAYLHVIEGHTQGPRMVPGAFDLAILRRLFKNTYIANNGYDRALALRARRENSADLVAFGRAYIANPDLVERLHVDAPLNVSDTATFFGGGAHGYTDYPHLPGRSSATIDSRAPRS
jgi:N-ethylmaleimide reductase